MLPICIFLSTDADVDHSGGSKISRRGGANLVGGVNSRRTYILENLCVETNELRPLVGRAGCAP